MGQILVAGIEKFISARNASPEKRLEKWQKAATALPLLGGLKELEKLGIGQELAFSRLGGDFRTPTIYTPLCRRITLYRACLMKKSPGLRPVLFNGLRSAGVLAFLQGPVARGLFVRGPEVDALDSIAPSLKTETSLNATPYLLRAIPPGDSYGLLMQSRSHALNWRKEMLVELKNYLSVDYLSSEEVPGSLRELAKVGARSAKGIDLAVVMDRLQKACDAYAIGYMLYCGARLITDEMKESIFYLRNLGVSRVKRFDELLAGFGMACQNAEKKELPGITDKFVRKITDLVGPSLEAQVHHFLKNR